MDSIPAFLHLPSFPNSKRTQMSINFSSPIDLEHRFLNDQLNSSKNRINSSTFALHQSILDGRIKQVNYFLKMGSKVNSKDKYGRTCLILAALSDHEDYGLQVAKLLIKYGADLNIRDSLGRTAVYTAITENREKLFDYFFDYHSTSIDFRIKDNDGNILLNHAAVYGNRRILQKIIEKMKERKLEFDQRNNAGYSALLLAIQNDKFLNAYTLVKDAQSSIALRDNQKYLNAIEWLINRIEVYKEHFSNQESDVQDPAFINFKSDLSFDLRKSKKVKIYKTNGNNNTNNGNYKTWYPSNNQYHNDDSKCEHSETPNYSFQQHKSRYTPLILTPRNSNYSQQRFLSPSASISLKDSIKEKSTEDLTEIDERTDLKELIQKLYEKIFSKMSESFKLQRQSSFSNEKQNQENEKLLLKSSKSKLRSGSIVNKQNDGKQNVQSLQSMQHKEMSNEEPKPIIPYRVGTNIFNLESMRQTPKLIALTPVSRQSVKDALHKMLNLYDSSLSFTKLEGCPSKTPEFIYKREKSKNKMNKEASNIIENLNSESALKLWKRLQNKLNFKNLHVTFSI